MNQERGFVPDQQRENAAETPVWVVTEAGPDGEWVQREQHDAHGRAVVEEVRKDPNRHERRTFEYPDDAEVRHPSTRAVEITSGEYEGRQLKQWMQRGEVAGQSVLMREETAILVEGVKVHGQRPEGHRNRRALFYEETSGAYAGQVGIDWREGDADSGVYHGDTARLVDDPELKAWLEEKPSVA